MEIEERDNDVIVLTDITVSSVRSPSVSCPRNEETITTPILSVPPPDGG